MSQPLMSLRIDGPAVVILDEHGRAVFTLPWNAADELAKGLTIAARKAETNAKANQIVFDQAFMMRAGAPFGLSADPKIIDEAKKEAAHNSEIRKMLPATPDERGELGVPALVKG